MAYIPLSNQQNKPAPAAAPAATSPRVGGISPGWQLSPNYKPATPKKYTPLTGQPAGTAETLIQNEEKKKVARASIDEAMKKAEDLTSWKNVLKLAGQGMIEPIQTSINKRGIVGTVEKALYKIGEGLYQIPWRLGKQFGLTKADEVQHPTEWLLTAIGHPEWIKSHHPIEVKSYTEENNKLIDQGVDWRLATLLTSSEALLDLTIIGSVAEGVLSKSAAKLAVGAAPKESTAAIKAAAEELGVATDASADAVKVAYYSKAHLVHPDVVGGSGEAFSNLAKAYETLTGVAPKPLTINDIAEMLIRPRSIKFPGGISAGEAAGTAVKPAVPALKAGMPELPGAPTTALIPQRAAVPKVIPLTAGKPISALEKELIATGYTLAEAREIAPGLAKETVKPAVPTLAPQTAAAVEKLRALNAPESLIQEMIKSATAPSKAITPPPTGIQMTMPKAGTPPTITVEPQKGIPQAIPAEKGITPSPIADLIGKKLTVEPGAFEGIPVEKRMPDNLAEYQEKVIAQAIKEAGGATLREKLIKDIRSLGGVKSYRGKFMSEELRGLPLTVRNNKTGSPLDQMVEALNRRGWQFESDDDILDVFRGQSPEAGFITPQAIGKLMGAPFEIIDLLDKTYYKIIGKKLETGLFNALEKSTKAPTLRKLISYAIGKPELYTPKQWIDLKRAMFAEKSGWLIRIQESANAIKKLKPPQIKEMRTMIESGNFPDNPVGKLAKQVEDDFFKVGEGLVEVGIFTPENFAKYAGKYYPYFYKIFEQDSRLSSWFKKRLDLSYMKMRKDLPEELRQAYGIIEDSPYPVAKRMIQEVHDLAMARMYNAAAQVPTISREFAVGDIHAKRMGSLQERMVDSKGWVQLPKSKKLGNLSEKWVDPAVAEDLETSFWITGNADALWQEMITFFKLVKVPLNLPTAGRNMINNWAYLSWLLGDVPPTNVMVWTDGLQGLIRKDADFKFLMNKGVIGTEFLPTEVEGVLSIFEKSKNPMVTAARAATTFGSNMTRYYTFMEQWSKLTVYKYNKDIIGQEAAADKARYAIFDYSEVPSEIQQLRRGTPKGKLGVFGFALQSPFITYKYFAYPRFLLSAATRKPFSISSYFLLKWGVRAMAVKMLADKYKENEEEIWKWVRAADAYFRTKGKSVLLMPSSFTSKFKNLKTGQQTPEEVLQFLDLTFIEPWGDINEFKNMVKDEDIFTTLYKTFNIFGNPFITIGAQMLANKDFYTGQEITTQLDTGWEATWKKFTYALMNFGSPNFLTWNVKNLYNKAKGLPDYQGITPELWTEVESMFGLRQRYWTPRLSIEEVQRMAAGISKEAQSQIFKVYFNQTLTEEQKRTKIQEIIDKIKTAPKVKEAQELIAPLKK
jgi:hypothetical protein